MSYRFFFNDTATTEIYTLSLHDALPISQHGSRPRNQEANGWPSGPGIRRSEEHTSELQSRQYLVCRLLLEKTDKIDKGFTILEDWAENAFLDTAEINKERCFFFKEARPGKISTFPMGNNFPP